MWHMVFLPSAVQEQSVAKSVIKSGRRGELTKRVEEKIVEVVVATPGITSGGVAAYVQKAIPEAKLSRVHVIMTALCEVHTRIRREGKRGSYTHYPADPEA